MTALATKYVIAVLLLAVMTISLSGLIPPAPASNFTEWTIPTSNSASESIAASGSLVYFAEEVGNKIGMLDTSTGVFTEWTIPTASSEPLGIAVSGGLVYFTEWFANKIGALNPSTGVFTEWAVPTTGSYPQGIVVSGSLVYFTESAANKIGLLDTSTGVFTEWTITTISSDPVGLAVSGGLVYFIEKFGNKIGALNPSTGVFNEWTVPTAGSDPLVIALSGSLVYFIEEFSNNIGEFTFSPVTTLYTYVPVTVSTVTTGSAVSTASNSALATNTVSSSTTSTGSVTEATTSVATNLADTFTVQPTLPFNTKVPLVQGWNLISLPVVPNSTAITSAQLKYLGYGLFFTGPANSVNNMFNKTGLASVTSVWTYNGKSWLDCIVSGGSCLGSLTTMVDGSGYWVYTTSSGVMLSFNGVVVPPLSAPPSYSLVNGWNLVGFKPQPSVVSETVSTYLSSITGDYAMNSVWIYNNPTGTWSRGSASTMILVGDALWVYMTTPATLRP